MQNEYLVHAGVKGMKWGVRKKTGTKEQKKWDKKVNKQWYKANNIAAYKMNNGLIADLNERHKGVNIYDVSTTSKKKKAKAYLDDYNKVWSKTLGDAMDDMFGKRPE